MDAAALLAQSAAWATSGKGGAEPAAVQTSPAGANTGKVVGAAGPRAAPTTAPAPTVAPVAPELSATQLAEGLHKTAKASGDAKTQSLQGATPPAEAPVVPDGKALAANQKGATDLHMAPALAAAVANVAAAVVSRREDQPRERSVFRSGTEETVAPQAISTAAPTLTVSSSPEVIAPTDAFVAEKVSYWISNNVQNAEMTLDGIGDRPVEVSIRMQGNEAHVAFRTDELQTRAALENASAHLKDMLQREGLVLSGVSVGTAGTGDSGAQNGQPRQGARQATVTTLQPLGGDLRGVSNRATSGGLDLFV
jgi:flagellar hook-length control protein FliK